MEWMLLPYRRYSEFTGRSRRKEFWLFALFQWLALIAIAAVFGTPRASFSTGSYAVGTVFDSTGALAQQLFLFASLVPNLAVSVRRLHDQDKSGWLLLLLFVPVLGWFTLFVFYCSDGTRGPNRYGPDPKNPTDIDAFT